MVGNSSLLFANGQRHVEYRAVLGPAMRGRSLMGYRALISSVADDAIEKLSRTPTVLLLADWARSLALHIVGRIVVGGERATDSILDRYGAWVDGALGTRRKALAYRYLRGPSSLVQPWGPFIHRRAQLRRELLAEAHRCVSSGDLSLAKLLILGDHALGMLPDEELVDQIMSLLFAGHETTASAIAWTLFWLDQNPALNSDLREELESTTSDGSDGRDVPLLDAVCRESLRISPPATIAGSRILGEDGEYFGRGLPAGTKITPCIYLAHHQPDIYPGPLRFDADRFLKTRRSSSEFFPFGGGVRRCLGSDLAMMELRMVVAAMVRQVVFVCPNPKQGVPQQRGPAMGLGRNVRMEMSRR
ncbi:cytochrome P450 [Streptomyces sp. SID13031]|uniref:cytochrome P450 n=1 Tax=Streptomyces sp. SID13031 TaxID=2706046 RepID=UPI0013CB37C9|nr:cytochrome P450 [Streptomyces sp. SID13031]NEA36909.1 cytochrome P450 [Streptomyces sp. SID13031]